MFTLAFPSKGNGSNRLPSRGFFFYSWLKEITNSQIIFQTASQSPLISITFPCAHVHTVGLLPHSHLRITGSNGASGFCRTVPKTLTKTKATAEVKGRQVFGIPLLVSVQQTGEPLPPCILRALVYLRTECLDQVNTEDEFRSPVNSFNKALSYIVLAKHLQLFSHCFVRTKNGELRQIQWWAPLTSKHKS